MEPGTGASVGQRVTGDVVRLSRNSSSTLSPLILFLHMLHNRGSTCSSCVGVQRVLILGKTLGVLIAQGQLWGCNPCAGAGSVQGMWGLWRSLSGVLGWNRGLLGATAGAEDYQRWEQ